MSKAMSLKAKIRNIAKQKNIPAQVILQNYMFERLLVRLSASEYKEKFVLKGGMLVAAIVGLDNRATMDLDTTLKNLPLTPEAIRNALEGVCNIAFDDGVVFEIGTIYPIREDDIYGGYRVMLNARFDTLLTPLSIDVSTGDVLKVKIFHPFRKSRLSRLLLTNMTYMNITTAVFPNITYRQFLFTLDRICLAISPENRC